MAGTTFREEGGYNSAVDSFEGQSHVAGQCQIFRRQCFAEIGGYRPNKAGGIDWMAVTSRAHDGVEDPSRFARSRSSIIGRLGTAERGKLASSFSYGEKDYYLGGHPVWEIFRVAYRMTKRPYLMDGLALGAGYLWAFVTPGQKPPVSEELMRFHRKEQMQKLRNILRSLVTCGRCRQFQVSGLGKSKSRDNGNNSR